MSSASLEQPAIRANGIGKAFTTRSVLDGVDLAIPPGEVFVIVGESGCGKSTLLRLFAGLETADVGDVDVRGQVSIAFQDARLLPWLPVWENVAFGLDAPSAQRRTRALAALEEVGLARLANAWPATLSGGEAQRAALARAMIRNPAVLLLDEPFGALDALTRLRMHRLLQTLWERHRFTVVLVTHDVDEALALGDRVIVLGRGRVRDEISIDIARPRSRTTQSFDALRDRLLQELGVPQA
jgi:sulfonate transport system ATP-binding protein